MPTKTKKQGADVIRELVVFLDEQMGLGDVEDSVGGHLKEVFDRNYAMGNASKNELENFEVALAQARQYQTISEAEVAKHPAFVALAKKLAKGIARGARKQSLEFQLHVVTRDQE